MGATSWNFELFLKQAAHGNWGSYLEQYADQVLADQNALATADAKLKSDEANEPNNLSLIQADAAAVEHDLGKTHDDELSMVNALINNECAIMESMGGGLLGLKVGDLVCCQKHCG